MLKSIILTVSTLLAATVGAGAAELALTFSGSDFDGGPAFEVKLGKTVVGTGVVDPIPPSGQGYEYSFQLPDVPAATAQSLSIRMTNDAFKGKGQDRNLYLLAARIDGTAVPLTSFGLTRKGEPFTRNLIAGRLELWNNQEVASLPMSGDAPSPGDVVVAPPPTGNADAPAKVAVAAAPAAATCTANAAVVGIQTVSKPLSKSQMAVLGKVVAQAKATSCAIVLKGYATQGGSAESNNKASLARAKLVLDTLKKQGLSFASESVTGAGSTNQFGSDDASNQRVSVALVAPGQN